jgi:hypothetical protein
MTALQYLCVVRGASAALALTRKVSLTWAPTWPRLVPASHSELIPVSCKPHSSGPLSRKCRSLPAADLAK